jgi:hypothetical protein
MDRTLVIQWAREAGIPVGITGGNPSMEEVEAFAKLVAEQAIKYGPSYQVGYADGEFAERERLTKLLQEGGK